MVALSETEKWQIHLLIHVEYEKAPECCITISWLSGPTLLHLIDYTQSCPTEKVQNQHFIVFSQNYKYQPSVLISRLEISPIMWGMLLPCCCMWKLRPWGEDWPSYLVVSQNLMVTLPGTNRGSLNWAVTLIGAVMTPTPDDTTEQWEGRTGAAENSPHNKYMTLDLLTSQSRKGKTQDKGRSAVPLF